MPPMNNSVETDVHFDKASKEQRGRFVVFEGVEGVGKSTQAQALTSWLVSQNIPHLVTREPGGTPLAEMIRDLVLQPRDEPICKETELFLMMSARLQHWNQVIQPALAKGVWVVCDRFIDSSIAYQGAGRGLSQELIRSLHQQIQPQMQPDLVIVLDMPLEASLARVASRGEALDRMEQASVDFFIRARESFLISVATYPDRYECINATQSVTDIAKQVQLAVSSRFFKSKVNSHHS